MKWQHVRSNLERDPWLSHVLFHSYIVREYKMPDQGLQQSIADCNITHVMFRGSTNSLDIDSRPVCKGLRISSAPVHTTENPIGYDHFNDTLRYEIGYYLVVQASDLGPPTVVHLSHTPDPPTMQPDTRSIRWAGVQLARQLRDVHFRWIAVVRNISIVSQAEYLSNGYDVFKFPAGFTPFKIGWHLKSTSAVSA